MRHEFSIGRHAILFNLDPAQWSPPAALKWGAALLAAHWVHVPGGVRTLLELMAADYLSGMAVALLNRELCSAKGFRGFVKKALTLMVVWAVRLASRDLGVEFDITNWLVIPLCANELISILENCARGGAPIPQKAMDFLLAVKKLGAVATKEQIAELTSRRNQNG